MNRKPQANRQLGFYGLTWHVAIGEPRLSYLTAIQRERILPVSNSRTKVLTTWKIAWQSMTALSHFFLLLSSFENSGSDSRCSSDYLPSRLLNSCYCYCIYCEPFCHLMSFLFKVVKRGFTRHFAGPCPTVRFLSLHNTGHTHTHRFVGWSEAWTWIIIAYYPWFLNFIHKNVCLKMRTLPPKKIVARNCSCMLMLGHSWTFRAP